MLLLYFFDVAHLSGAGTHRLLALSLTIFVLALFRVFDDVCMDCCVCGWRLLIHRW